MRDMYKVYKAFDINGSIIGGVRCIDGEESYELLKGYSKDSIHHLEEVEFSEVYVGILSDCSVIDDEEEVKDDLNNLLDEIYFK